MRKSLMTVTKIVDLRIGTRIYVTPSLQFKNIRYHTTTKQNKRYTSFLSDERNIFIKSL